jgi:hypothetical protein
LSVFSLVIARKINTYNFLYYNKCVPDGLSLVCSNTETLIYFLRRALNIILALQELRNTLFIRCILSFLLVLLQCISVCIFVLWFSIKRVKQLNIFVSNPHCSRFVQNHSESFEQCEIEVYIFIPRAL